MRITRAFTALAAFAVVATLAGCGSDGSDNQASKKGRTVTVTMTDMAFAPKDISVTAGESVTFRFVNDGTVTHEATIGSEQEQMEHAEEMKEMATSTTMDMGDGSMDMGGQDHSMHKNAGDVVTVAPGQEASMTRTFDEAGTLIIGCHQPGHWEAGMRATIDVG